jgi:hypothetical protein
LSKTNSLNLNLQPTLPEDESSDFRKP